MKILGIALGIMLIFLIAPSMADANIQHKPNFGSIKDPIQQKSITITQIIKPRTMHFWYIVDIEVCAGPVQLYSPELVISSDRDTIQQKFWGIIMPHTCDSNRFFISAKDPDSITVSFSTNTIQQISP